MSKKYFDAMTRMMTAGSSSTRINDIWHDSGARINKIRESPLIVYRLLANTSIVMLLGLCILFFVKEIFHFYFCVTLLASWCVAHIRTEFYLRIPVKSHAVKTHEVIDKYHLFVSNTGIMSAGSSSTQIKDKWHIFDARVSEFRESPLIVYRLLAITSIVLLLGLSVLFFVKDIFDFYFCLTLLACCCVAHIRTEIYLRIPVKTDEENDKYHLFVNNIGGLVGIYSVILVILGVISIGINLLSPFEKSTIAGWWLTCFISFVTAIASYKAGDLVTNRYRMNIRILRYGSEENAKREDDRRAANPVMFSQADEQSFLDGMDSARQERLEREALGARTHSSNSLWDVVDKHPVISGIAVGSILSGNNETGKDALLAAAALSKNPIVSGIAAGVLLGRISSRKK